MAWQQPQLGHTLPALTSALSGQLNCRPGVHRCLERRHLRVAVLCPQEDWLAAGQQGSGAAGPRL